MSENREIREMQKLGIISAPHAGDLTAESRLVREKLPNFLKLFPEEHKIHEGLKKLDFETLKSMPHQQNLQYTRTQLQIAREFIHRAENAIKD
jgi:hypothetical protein